LLEGETADLVLTDPPFNVRVDGNVSGLGKVRHEEFAMASGEMSEAEFIAFLSTFLGCAKAHSRNGAILFVFMDWRHLFELTCAGRKAATFDGIDLTFEDFEGARASSPASHAVKPLPPAGPAEELPQ
jgi:hypothetical protein